MIVTLGLQVGVNYANDYSDGIRGTDRRRVGPMRLVGSGAAAPPAVKRAAWLSFGLSAIAGGLLIWLSEQWWMAAVGMACILAAWYYTGGRRPYGYRGLGEVMVFIFFGLVAVLGTTLTQAKRISWPTWWAACGVGALACAILLANNLRDIPTDRRAGKFTLAVRIGEDQSRWLFTGLVIAAALTIVLMLPQNPWVALGLLAFPLAAEPVRAVLIHQDSGPGLIPVLGATGRLQLAYAALVGAGLALG